MKKILLCALVCMSLSATVSANAANQLKIGIIDMGQILQKSALVVSMNDGLVKKFKSRQDEINTANKDLQDEANQLQYSSAGLTDADKSKLQNKILTDKANLQILDASFQRDLAIAKDEGMQTFMAKFSEVINKVAKDGNYDIIEQRANVTYVNAQLDITSEVLKQLS
jgi:outer membrane protein